MVLDSRYLSGPVCAEEEFAAYGHPFFFPARDGTAFGVSSMNGSLYFWADNQMAGFRSFSFGCYSSDPGLSYFSDHLELYNSSGNSIPRRSPPAISTGSEKQSNDEQILDVRPRTVTEPPITELPLCNRNYSVTVSPHTIRMIDKWWSISELWTVPPGVYVLNEKVDSEEAPKPNPGVPAGLVISISSR